MTQQEVEGREVNLITHWTRMFYEILSSGFTSHAPFFFSDVCFLIAIDGKRFETGICLLFILRSCSVIHCRLVATI